MCFFFDIVRALDEAYSSLFRSQVKEDGEEGEGPEGEGVVGEGSEGDNEGPTTYDWLNLVGAVHEETGFNFDEVFNSPARDFIAYLAYINEKRSRQEAEIRKMKGQTRLA